MSKLLNDPNHAVRDYLHGLSIAHPGQVRVDHERRVVFRAEQATASKVALISGGGSGHEPLHTCFVGAGMLDAACVGEIFSSPTPSQILTAIEGCASDAGVLLIVKNYTGDRLNFEIAAERAVANGIDVRSLLVDDEVSSGSVRGDGRRGVGLTVLVEKILGAGAELGWSLDRLEALGNELRTRARSMGVGLTSCTHPVAGSPTFDIGPDEMEVGIGIHGEPGCRRSRTTTAAGVAELLLGSILSDLKPESATSFIVLVNGMGGTPLIELHVMAGAVADQLAGLGHHVDRYLVGSFITSLEMAGCSLTLLAAKPQTLELWDAPASTPALTMGVAA